MLKGRKPDVPLNDQKRVYVQFQHVFGKGLPPTTHEVFKNIEELLNHKMSAKSVYLSIQRNFRYFFEHSIEVPKNKERPVLLPISTPAESQHETGSRSLSPDSDVYLSSGESVCEKHHIEKYINCNFEIDKIVWQDMQPKNYFYRRNNTSATQSSYSARCRLQNFKWTNIIQEHLWINMKSRCTWCFKYNFAKNNYETIAKGYCNQCPALITVTTKYKSENFVGVQCNITHYNKAIKHTTKIKNKLHSSKRRVLKEKLHNESAISLRYKLAGELMKENDNEPSILPNLGTLRRLKYESHAEKRLHTNPILSLACMAVTPPHDKLIRNVSAYPFYVHYWTDDQEKYFKTCQQKVKYVRLSIDATGSIFSKELRPIVNDYTSLASQSQGPLFLYVVMTDTTIKSSVPLAQMISETHTAANIEHWLQTWITNGKPPDEVVSDDSAAILGAAIKVFNGNESTSDYLNQCFALLRNQSCQKPKCYVRLDTSHFIKTLHNQGIFEHTDYRIKLFYIQCIQIMKQSTSYKDILQMMKDINTIANSKYRGCKESDGSETICEISLKRLRHIIHSDKNVTRDLSTITSQPCNSEVYKTKAQCNDIFESLNDEETVEFYNKTNQDTLDLDVTQVENLFYFPNVIHLLHRLFRRLPLWGNVMNPVFNSRNLNPTSSNAENYFKDIKKHFFKTAERLYRVDEFVASHEKFITGAIRLCNSDIKEKENNANIPPLDDTNPSFYDNSIFQNNPVKVENWRGLIENKTKQRSGNHYLDPLILRNGTAHLRELLPLVQNTCGFDAVVQSFAIAFKDRPEIRFYINSVHHELTSLIKSLLTFKTTVANAKKRDKSRIGKDTLMKIYIKRTEILTQIYNEKIIQNTLDCADNVSKVIDWVPFHSAERFLKCTNTKCTLNQEPKAVKCSWLPLNVNILNEQGIKFLQAAVIIKDFKKACKASNCSGFNTYDYQLSHFLFFEFHSTNKIQLCEIPIKLNISGETFTILSLIDFTNGGPNMIGHYKAICYRHNNKTWECYDDLKSYMTPCNPRDFTVPHCMIYTKSYL